MYLHNHTECKTYFTFDFITDTFNQYDYGKFKNVLYYNSIVPPSYNISSIQVPITLFYGDNDKVSTPEVHVFFLYASLLYYFNLFIFFF